MSSEPIEVSALLVIRSHTSERSEILNVLAYNKTKYGFPGGKLEKGESPEAAVIRETEEELGVTPTDIVYINTFKAFTPEGREIKMHVFTGHVSKGIVPSAEIKELHWLTYEDMTKNMDVLTPMTIDHVLPILKHV